MSRRCPDRVPTPVVVLFLALEIYSKLDQVIKKNIRYFLGYHSLLVKCARSDLTTVLAYFQDYQKSLVMDVPTMSRPCPDMSRHVPTPVMVFLVLKIYLKLDWVTKKLSKCFFEYHSLVTKCAQSDPITVLTYFQS